MLRDIRDDKYPSIVKLHLDVKNWREQVEEYHRLVLGLKDEVIAIKDDMQRIKDEVVVYITNEKKIIEQIKKDTEGLRDETSLIKDSVVILRDETKGFRDEAQEILDKVSIMNEGIGITINADGHMIVTYPDSSSIKRMWIDANGHLMAELK